MKLHVERRFETQSDWLAYLATLDSLPNNYSEDTRRTRNDRFTGGSFALARSLAKDGWQDGAKQLAETARAAVRQTGSMARPSLSYDVGGAYPDVPLAISGDPLCMVNIGDDIIQTRPIIRMYVEMCAPHWVTADQLRNFGAAILSQIDALEDSGARVEINLVWTNKASDMLHQVFIVAKQAAEPIDFERLAFLIVHPAMFRRLMFDVFSRDPAFIAVARTSWLGQPARAMVPDDGIVIPAISENAHMFHELASAIKLIQEQMEEGLAKIGHQMKFER